MKKILFSLLATLFAVGLFAQSNAARQAAINNISITTASTDLSSAERAEAVTKQIARVLNISAAQREAMYQINLDAAKKMDEIAKYAQSDIVPRKHAALFEDTNNKILRILKPEQQTQYQAIIQKSMQYKKFQSAKG